MVSDEDCYELFGYLMRDAMVAFRRYTEIFGLTPWRSMYEFMNMLLVDYLRSIIRPATKFGNVIVCILSA